MSVDVAEQCFPSVQHVEVAPCRAGDLFPEHFRALAGGFPIHRVLTAAEAKKLNSRMRGEFRLRDGDVYGGFVDEQEARAAADAVVVADPGLFDAASMRWLVCRDGEGWRALSFVEWLLCSPEEPGESQAA